MNDEAIKMVRLEERVHSLQRQCTQYMNATTVYKLRVGQMSDFIEYLMSAGRITQQELNKYVDNTRDAKKKLGMYDKGRRR